MACSLVGYGDRGDDNSPRERQLWRRFAAQRDQAAREELTRIYLPLAKRLAARYRGANEPLDDLRQVACLGLVNAIDRFDPGRGIPFAAYAAPTIMGELKRHFRDRAWTIKVPRGLHDLMPEVDKTITKLSRELRRSPSVGEIAAKLEVEPAAVLEAMEAGERRRPLSIDRPLSAEGDETPAAELIGAVDDGFELAEDRLALGEALHLLDTRERVVLRHRFAEELTQAEIAERIGCSQMHVSRILRRALARIRDGIEGSGCPADAEPPPGGGDQGVTASTRRDPPVRADRSSRAVPR